MSRGRSGLRDRWRDEAVIPHGEIGDACKVLLLVMATKMTDAGYLSGVSRERLADLLGVHPRRVAERIATATRHGLLTKIGGGYPGHTAEYVATIPAGLGAAERHPSRRKGAGERHPLSVTHSPGESDRKGAAERHTIARVTTERRQSNHRERNAGDSPSTGAAKDGNEGKAPTGSLIAASPDHDANARDGATRAGRASADGAEEPPYPRRP